MAPSYFAKMFDARIETLDQAPKAYIHQPLVYIMCQRFGPKYWWTRRNFYLDVVVNNYDEYGALQGFEATLTARLDNETAHGSDETIR